MENILNFIIFSFYSSGTDMTGGNIVSHKLAYKLAERGHTVSIFCDPIFPHPNIKKLKAYQSESDTEVTSHSWESFTYDYNTTISIYPQTTYGNPFNTKHVTRWILYHTLEGVENTFEDSDVYFNFNDFKTFKNVEKRKLTTFDYKLDKLYITNNYDREGFCHIIHKNTPKNYLEILKTFNSYDLSNFKTEEKFNFDFLREQFNKFEYFITFDKNSFFTTAACLCGCKSIILNPESSEEFFENAYVAHRKTNPEILPFEYRKQNPIQNFGVAYGLSDITWANKTIGLTRTHIKHLEIMDDTTIDNFIKFWQTKIYN